MKTKTVEEFFNSYGATKVLKQNLAINLEALCHKLSQKEKETLMRLNMIVIRQALQDFGVE